MNKIKLIAIDIDETLLNQKHQIVPSTIDALKRVRDHGGKVVLCSGRPLSGVTPYLKQIGLAGEDQYVITYNGGIIETIAGTIIKKHPLAQSDFERIHRFSEQHHVHFNVLDDQSKIYTTNHQLNWYTITQADENKAGLTILDPQDFPFTPTLIKGVWTGEVAELNHIEELARKEFNEGYYVVRSMPVFLEVSNQKANKGDALKDLATYLNLSLENVMAIGDEMNDYTMLQTAGTAVAMGNANPKIKELADYITADNNHDGIAEAVAKFFD